MDDASSDETPAILDRWSDQDFQIQVLRNPKNSGFVASCNRGAAAANGDVLVFLNNDTLPQPGWLHPLLKTLQDESAAGAVSGKLLYPDGRLQEAGGVVFSDGTACNFGRNEPAGTPLFNFLREVDYGSGALLATWRDLFTDLGGFDTRFEPAYYEDTDYCFAVRSKGYRVYYQPRKRGHPCRRGFGWDGREYRNEALPGSQSDQVRREVACCTAASTGPSGAL